MSTEHPEVGHPDVVLHQEQVQFGVDRVAVRAVLRRRIVTEVQQFELTVRREVLEVEHLPAEPVPAGSGDPSAAPGTSLPGGQEPLVIVLSEEYPVVQLQTRPYEQVTVRVEHVTEQREVSATVGTEDLEITTTPAPGAAR